MSAGLDVDALARFVTGELQKVADPSRAPAMAAYMKTDMPFYGVQKAGRTSIIRAIKQRFPPGTDEEYAAGVRALWRLPHREEKYIALAYAMQHKRFRTIDQLELYEELIRQGAWWDLVDGVASDLVGILHLQHRDEVQPVMERWIDDDDLWIRRTAIISQLKHRDEADEELLFRHCLKRAHETDFFIRKAIGWALRQHSRARPDAVCRFVDEHEDELSGLSKREARKHLTAR